MKLFKMLTNKLNIKGMEYSYVINDVNRLVSITVIGELYANDFAKLHIEVCSLALKRNYKLIFDFTNTNIRISIGEAYFWFSDHLDRVNMSFRRIPIAFITNELDKMFFSFVEVAWTNRGIRIKIFKEVKSALEWFEQFENVNVKANIGVSNI